jgi:hypothetical protein
MPLDEVAIEDLLDQCLETYDEDPDRFTEWEQGFLETIRERADWSHFSPTEEEKIEEIFGERVAR